MRLSFGLLLSVCLWSAACVPPPPAGPQPTGTATSTPAPTSASDSARGVRPIATPAPPAPEAYPAFTPRPASTAIAIVTKPWTSLEGLLDGVLPDPSHDYGIVLEVLGSEVRLAVNDAQVFPSASLYKLGVAWLALRQAEAGVISLDDSIPVIDDDAVEVEPDGGLAPGETPTVREALGAMLSVSSNAAAHALLRTLGRDTFNQEMLRLGLAQTRVPLETDDQAVSAESSAAEIARLLRLLATSPELGASARHQLERWLSTNNPPDVLRDTLPSDIGILDKTGNLDDASNVGALLQSERDTVILVVLDRGVDPGDARGVIARLGQIAYQAFLRR
jgi:beta-lactamase class A